MTRKKVLKITPVLVTLNIIVLLIIVGFYSLRLVKYYKLEHTSKGNKDTVLVDALIKKQSFLDDTKGLVYDKENNFYRYKGDVDDNYVSYSGILFRVISIDENKNIKMISDDVLTLMYSGLEKGYNSSFINKWLNISESDNSGIFESILYNSEKLITKTNLCLDNVDDLEKITCNDIDNNNNVTLLSLYDYKECGGSSSFLNNGTSFNLSTLNSENNNYYVNSNGEIGLNQTTTKVNGVRAVITINGKTINISGKGTKENPYKIEKHSITKLNETYVGDYIRFSNNSYRVVEINDNKVKVVLDGVITENDENKLIAFSDIDSDYNSNGTLYKYLNNTYYKSLENNKFIVSSDWYTNTLDLSNLDYTEVYNNKVKANIGILNLGEFFINEYNNVFTLSRGIESSNIINVINSDGNFYGDLVTSKYNVRPAMYLDGNLEIVSGVGSEYGPYELGEVNEQSEKE